MKATQSLRSFSGSPRGVVSSPCYPIIGFPRNSSWTAGGFIRWYSVHTQPQWKVDIELIRTAWTTVKQEHSLPLLTEIIEIHIAWSQTWPVLVSDDWFQLLICLTGKSAANKQTNWTCAGARLQSSYRKRVRNHLLPSVFCLERTGWTLQPYSGKFLS